MNFSEHVFRYCERGASDALLAEPINVISNVAFLFAALIGLQLLLWRPREERSADHYLLVFLVLAIGAGSLVFHLFATEGTELLDVVPIGLFILVYLGFALNRFLGVPVGVTVLLVIGFIAIMAMTGQVRCWDGGVGLPGPEIQGAKPCLNGSVFYLPALAALLLLACLPRSGGIGRRLSVVGRGDPHHLHHTPLARFRAVRPYPDRRARSRHPTRLAHPQRVGPISLAAGESRRGTRSRSRARDGTRSRGVARRRSRRRAPGSG